MGRSFELLQAYLHLFRLGSAAGELVEVLALHTEPSVSHRYKKGPHFHVVEAADPLPHCHFPLNLDRLSEVTSSMDSLDEAIRSAIGVVTDEVLERYRMPA